MSDEQRAAAQRNALTKFWVQWRKGAPKIELLRLYVRWSKFGGYHGRLAFQRSGIQWKRECGVCGDQKGGLHRHHIIQLSHGGENIRANIVTLCRYCHRLVHGPKTNARLKVGVLHQPRKLGHPRLVRRGAFAAVNEGDAPASHLQVSVSDYTSILSQQVR